MYWVSWRRVPRPSWPGSAPGPHESVASKEIEDLDKLRDVKILLFGLLGGVFDAAKALSRKK
mgnify:CR=1 FL=1